MKRKVTYLFAFSVLLVYSMTVLRGYMPYLSYRVNFKYISTVLCENKTKPVLQCQGKCHLQKELKKSAEDESKNNSKITIQLELEDMPVQSFELVAKDFFIITASQFLFSEKKAISSVRNLISPPPQA